MAITAVFDGYVAKDPIFSQGEYGKYAEVSLRVGLAGREVHYVTARFYGKRIPVVTEYIHNGDYMTMSGSINSIQHRTREGGIRYCQIYLKDAFFTIPPKIIGNSLPRVPDPSPDTYRLDEPADTDDNEIRF